MLPLKKILCPIDFSEPSLVALEAACEMAGQFDAELCLLHVVPLSAPFPSDLMAISIGTGEPDTERVETARKHLQEIAATRVPSGIKAHCEVRMGYADKEIVATAEDVGAGMLVISTHGLTGWRHLVFGSVAEAIVRAATCPVLTVHAPSSEVIEVSPIANSEPGQSAAVLA